MKKLSFMGKGSIVVLLVLWDLCVVAQPTTRSLTEVNVFEESESYPFLSSDAKSLYFIKSTSPGQGILKKGTRTSTGITDQFGSISQVSTPDDNNLHSFTLSADELKIYYTTWNKSLYYVNRASSGASFTIANRKQICLCDFNGPVHNSSDDLWTLTTPSVSADQNTLYLYYNNKYNGQILKFTKTTSPSSNKYPGGCPGLSTDYIYYQFAGTLTSPNLTAQGSFYSGQLDKNELNYDFSMIEILSGYKQRLYKSTNLSTTPTFVRQDDVYSPANGVVQPSFNSSRNIFVYVSSSGDWLDNDLQITYTASGVTLREDQVAEGESTAFQEADQVLLSDFSHVAIYPNPASEQVSIRVHEGTTGGTSTVQLFGANGQLYYETTLSGREADIPVSQLKVGLYYIKVGTPSGESVVKKLIIK